MPEKLTVITDFEFPDISLERGILADAGIRLEAHQNRTPAAIIPTVRDADALIVQYGSITADVIASLEHCRLIVRYGAGVNNIDVEAATRKGIFVCNVPDYGVDEVSNHAVMMIMALSRRLPAVMRRTQSGGWWDPSIEQIHRLAGSTVGLVGFGRIAQAVARKLSAFNVTVLAYHPRRDAAFMEARFAQKASLEEIARHSDFISLHCPLNPETEHLVDAAFLARMKPTACLINTARGSIVDEAALTAALQAGRIAGAGLDVFESEPLPASHPLYSLENVIITPHCAWFSQEASIDLRRKAAQEVVRVLGGGMPASLCNKEALSRRG